MRPHWKERLRAYPEWKLHKIAVFITNSERWCSPMWWDRAVSGGQQQAIFFNIYRTLQREHLPQIHVNYEAPLSMQLKIASEKIHHEE